MIASDDLFAAHPALAGRLDALCGGRSWGLAGASGLAHYEGRWYLEITKPQHWRRSGSRLVVGLGAPGGALEAGERTLAGLQRELAEELGVAGRVYPSPATEVVYEQRAQAPLRLLGGLHPAPALLTVSRNRYRRESLPQYQVLVIATYLTRLRGAPRLGDLFGLVGVPYRLLPVVLAPGLCLSTLRGLPGVRLMLARPLPADTLLEPVWTVRSLQCLLVAGRMPAAPSD